MEFEDLKVGMKIKGKWSSDKYYYYICSRDHYTGIITSIDKKTKTFSAKTLECDYKEEIGTEAHGIDPKHFMPYEKTLDEIPLTITYDSNNIYVFYKDKIVAKATCRKDKKYNKQFGLNLALKRFCTMLDNTTVLDEIEGNITQ